LKKRMLTYLDYLEKIDYQHLTEEEKEKLGKEILVQTIFFAHERMIHLIVTCLFAILAIMVLIAFTVTENIAFIPLFFLLMVLLVPYIMHYYLLENGTQKIYTYYDKIAGDFMDAHK